MSEHRRRSAARRARESEAAVRAAVQHRAGPVVRRSLGSPALFAIVYTTVAAALYISLGAVADHALGLTPAVYLIAALFFVLAAMTYVEGASLHKERAGSTVFARYAFNELVSFVAGWVLLLDYVILIALAAFTPMNDLAAFWGPLGHGTVQGVAAAAAITFVGASNIRGLTAKRVRRLVALAIFDIA